MTTRTATVIHAGDGLRFVATTGSGHVLSLDTADGDGGPRPAELLAVALAGCTGMDVLSILRKKRQEIDRYEVKVGTEQRDGAHPSVFTRIDLIHVVEGPSIEIAAVRRAIELSATRYCAVGGTLASGITEIHHRYLVRRAEDEEVMGEVLVTGPFADAGDLAATRQAAMFPS